MPPFLIAIIVTTSYLKTTRLDFLIKHIFVVFLHENSDAIHAQCLFCQRFGDFVLPRIVPVYYYILQLFQTVMQLGKLFVAGFRYFAGRLQNCCCFTLMSSRTFYILSREKFETIK